MKNFRKLSLIFLFITFFAFLLGSFSFAQKDLEVKYPVVPGVETPTTTETALPDYIKYIFNLSIIIAGLVAFGALLYGGVRWLTSAGSPAVMRDAKDQIFAGILGMIILLCSFLILTTINPQLVIIAPGELSLTGGIIIYNGEGEKKPLGKSIADLGDFEAASYEFVSSCEDLFAYAWDEPGYTGSKEELNCPIGSFSFPPKSIELQWKPFGVYLCKTSTKEECVAYDTSSATLPGDMNDQIGYLYFKNPEGVKHGAVLHQDQSQQGTCDIFFEEGGVSLPSGGVSSITVFYQIESTFGEGVTLFNCKDLDTECRGQEVKTWGPVQAGEYPNEIVNGGSLVNLLCDEISDPNERTVCENNKNRGFNDITSSIKIDGGYITVVFDAGAGDAYKGACEVFWGSDLLLKGNYIGNDKISSMKVLLGERR